MITFAEQKAAADCCLMEKRGGAGGKIYKCIYVHLLAVKSVTSQATTPAILFHVGAKTEPQRSH